MTKQYKVIVTAVGGNTGQGVVKALRSSGLKFFLVGIDSNPLSAGFSFVDKAFTVPGAGEPDLLAILDSIIRSETPDALYVSSPQEMIFFDESRTYLESKWGLKIFLPPSSVVRLGMDKLATAVFLEKEGFSPPRTCLITDEARLKTLVKEIGFPFIAKPRWGASSKNVFRVDSVSHLRALGDLVPDLLVQEYLPGEEYTATTLNNKRGKTVASIILHRELLQGTTYRTELFHSKKATDQIEQMAERLSCVGVCNFQFKIKNNQVCIFEINPRFSGTTGIRYLYGFNDPELTFRLFCLGEDIAQPILRDNVVLRYWNEVCIPGSSYNDLKQEAAKIRERQTRGEVPCRG